MLQTVQGKDLYIVVLERPLPKIITWDTNEEKPYAEALENALASKMITEPGKYGIEMFKWSPDRYVIYTIIE
jgi:hypothetical protein